MDGGARVFRRYRETFQTAVILPGGHTVCRSGRASGTTRLATAALDRLIWAVVAG